ncbi:MULTISPECIES: hypothetical protein, partial [unclassified Microbacterium]|uniref:hypothetical protein n=1 Tax=unclassified Microbacterium TaxID=2609290 RepID=UPI000D46D849
PVQEATVTRQIAGGTLEARREAYEAIEALVHEHPETGHEASVFHAMPLGPKFRTHREEHPHG